MHPITNCLKAQLHYHLRLTFVYQNGSLFWCTDRLASSLNKRPPKLFLHTTDRLEPPICCHAQHGTLCCRVTCNTTRAYTPQHLIYSSWSSRYVGRTLAAANGHAASLPSGIGAAGNGEHPTISNAKRYKSSPDQLDMDDLHMLSTPDLEALLSSFARKPAPWDEATVRLTRWIPHVLADRQWESRTNQSACHRSNNLHDPYPHYPQARITNWTSQAPAASVLPSTTRGTAAPNVTPTSSVISGNGEKFSGSSVPSNPGSPSPSERWQSVLEFGEQLRSRVPSSHGSPASPTSGARTPVCYRPSASPDGERIRDSSLQLSKAARSWVPTVPQQLTSAPSCGVSNTIQRRQQCHSNSSS